MEKSEIIALGEKAGKSRVARSEIQKAVKDELVQQIFSQLDVLKMLHCTNKPVSKAKLQDIMNNESFDFLKSKTGRYMLTIKDCYNIANKVGVTKYKEHGKKAFVTILQNLKGGVGKSLGTCMLAEALCLLERNLMSQIRVLVIDLDPQGTSTQQFLPGYSFNNTDVTSILAMADADMDREKLFEYAIKKTAIDNIDIIPAITDDGFLADELAHDDICAGSQYFNLLQERVIQSLEYDYDIILLDAGPHMDKVMKNCLAAANGIFIPTPHAYYSWDSTIRFIERLPSVFLDMIDQGYIADNLKFIAAYTSKDVSNKHSHDMDIYEHASSEMYEIFGHQLVLKHPLPNEAAYERCTDSSTTIFSMPKSEYTGSKDAYKRARISAELWAREMIEMIMYYHKECK